MSLSCSEVVDGREPLHLPANGSARGRFSFVSQTHGWLLLQLEALLRTVDGVHWTILSGRRLSGHSGRQSATPGDSTQRLGHLVRVIGQEAAEPGSRAEVGRVVREEDEHEFDALYRRFSPRIMGQAYAMTGSRASAEDLTQEAFGRAWVRWGRVRRLQNPEAWIRRVMLNQAISDWRKQSRPNLADPGARAGDESDVDAIWLADALRNLPANHCRAVVLHDAAGLTVPEIARELHVPAGTVKSWISRGRAALAVLLADSKEDIRHGRG